jgi:hypothetical protein
MDQATHRIERQQDALLDEMAKVRAMRRGTLSPQHYAERRARKEGAGATGPYFVWQGYHEGKHFSQRVPARQAHEIELEIEARKKFECLCQEYIRLGETLADTQDAQPHGDEALKKGLKSQRKPARK